MSEAFNIGAAQALDEQAKRLAEEWGLGSGPKQGEPASELSSDLDPTQRVLILRAMGYTSDEIREMAGNGLPARQPKPNNDPLAWDRDTRLVDGDLPPRKGTTDGLTQSDLLPFT